MPSDRYEQVGNAGMMFWSRAFFRGQGIAAAAKVRTDAIASMQAT